MTKLLQFSRTFIHGNALRIKLLLLLSAIITTNVFAQNSDAFTGTVLTGDGSPAIGAQVILAGSDKETVTDENGVFIFNDVKPGNYKVSISYLGYNDHTTDVQIGTGGERIDFTLKEQNGAIENVIIRGLSESEQVNRQAYNVAAIDAKKLYNTTLDLAHALDRVPGVRLRESGGVGSNMELSLNGFSGRQIKMFIDGIPMDNFGSSFQINNIPINLAERVEVYKGVVPVWLGADALGGAVNIVTDNKKRNYIDVGYSFGSFNTHRSSLNAAVTSKSGLTAEINLFQNYSDNNYKVTLDVDDIKTGAYTRDTTVRRFHDQYHNETAILNVGFVDKKWADKFLIGFVAGQNYREIQTGARMEAVFGQRHAFGNILMPTIKYKKRNIFIEGLDLVVNGNFNFGKETNVDTFSGSYDWYGRYKYIPGVGREASRQIYKYGNNTGVATASLNYKLNEQHSFALNHVITTFNRKGFDELDPYSERHAQPQITTKNVTGLSYQFNANDKFTSTIFGKVLRQDARTTEAFTASTSSETVYFPARSNQTNYGYGIATTYYIVPQLQTKVSYERAIRLPDAQELFGDVINTAGNFKLKPESTHNINLGFVYTKDLTTKSQISTAVTAIYRYSHDFIYMKFTPNQDKYILDNRAGVRTWGAEFDARYDYDNRLHIEINGTYQDIRNMVKYDDDGMLSIVYKDRLHNIPYLYGHAAASYSFNSLLDKGDRLTLNYNLLTVHPFFLYWPSQGNPKLKKDTDAQFSHDLTATYTLKGGRYNIALECRNFMDNQLFDNFELQKPGRAFSIKLRYFYAKK